MSETPDKDRWPALAQEALVQYGMAGAEINWLAHTHNAVFDVRYRDRHDVLRLSREQTKNHLMGEIGYLRLIRKLTALNVPHPVNTPRGEALYIHPVSRIYAVLFEYLEGTSPAVHELDESKMRLIGAFLATLHSIPAIHFMPLQSMRPRLDYEGLFGQNSLYHSDAGAALFTDEQRQVMQAVQDKVKAAMDEIGTEPANFGLIHGDLLLKNILFHEDNIAAIDFEYCGSGYYLYDLAPLLWQLKPEARYQTLEDALWAGYTSIRPLPRRDLLETVIAGRQVASMRWIAANRHHPYVAGKAPEILQQRTGELRGFLETGILRRKNSP